MWERALPHLRRTGLDALAGGAQREAAGCFEQAIDALERLPETADRKTAAGDTIEISFDRGVARTLFDPALSDAGGVGITAEGAAAGRARFDDFSFSPPAPRQP